ncbi:MAG: glycosyltransferase family 2 protein [Thermodesulfobacteriota bacterium]
MIIPAYNHADQILSVIEKALELGLTVIVVDDGSTDDTPAKLREAQGIQLLTHDRNLGKGAALMTGLIAAAARADWAITVDADGQHDPAEAINLIASVPRGVRPIVLGRRLGMKAGKVPWTSRWGRRFSNFWVWVAGGPWLADSQSGFRMYPLPETLDLQPRSLRFQFEMEILILAAWRGLPVIEAPINVRYDLPGGRVSHFKPGLDFWRNTKTILPLIAKRLFLPRRRRWP